MTEYPPPVFGITRRLVAGVPLTVCSRCQTYTCLREQQKFPRNRSYQTIRRRCDWHMLGMVRIRLSR